MVGLATLIAALLIGCDNEQNLAPSTDSNRANPFLSGKTVQNQNAPFKYHLVSKKEMLLTWGPQIVVNLETTNEVAKNATKEDLWELWQHMAPTLGDRRIFLYLKTPVPGALPWAVISRIKTDAEWELDIAIYEYGIDAEPYYFVNEIDRSIQNQRAMIVTLPMVNRLNEQLVLRGWNVKERQEDFYSAEYKRGFQSISITLTPERIDIYIFKAGGNIFPDTVDLVFTSLGIAEELKKRLYSVIGSPEYIRVKPGEPVQWTWSFGEIEVIYTRFPQIDDISAGYAG